MRAYWLTFEGDKPGCVDAESDYDAKLIGEHVTGKKVTKVESLPYPATPRIHSYIHPVYGQTPSFCTSPTECKGRTSCPQRYSCTE
jgi:hypothetical protein